MILDAVLSQPALLRVPEIARSAEEIGFGALWSSETQHDPFLPGVLVAEHTSRIAFGTAVAISFARSPGTLAYTAWDLAKMSAGRFILGLGTQVKPHIVRRFGMPWPDSVVGKLREQIQAVRALWHCWQTGEELSYRGKYFKLTLMTPFFNPGPIDHPQIPIYIAGVNTGLAKLAGECADGFLVHPLHSARYLAEVILPAIRENARLNKRNPSDIQISISVFYATTPQERSFIRSQIAFYASTPSYRSVMALHGWEEVGNRLSALVRRGRWSEMTDLISDEILETFAVVASARDPHTRLLERYRGLADRISLYRPFIPGECDDFWQDMVQNVKGQV